MTSTHKYLTIKQLASPLVDKHQYMRSCSSTVSIQHEVNTWIQMHNMESATSEKQPPVFKSYHHEVVNHRHNVKSWLYFVFVRTLVYDNGLVTWTCSVSLELDPVMIGSIMTWPCVIKCFNFPQILLLASLFSPVNCKAAVKCSSASRPFPSLKLNAPRLSRACHLMWLSTEITSIRFGQKPGLGFIFIYFGLSTILHIVSTG